MSPKPKQTLTPLLTLVSPIPKLNYLLSLPLWLNIGVWSLKSKKKKGKSKGLDDKSDLESLDVLKSDPNIGLWLEKDWIGHGFRYYLCPDYRLCPTYVVPLVDLFKIDVKVNIIWVTNRGWEEMESIHREIKVDKIEVWNMNKKRIWNKNKIEAD